MRPPRRIARARRPLHTTESASAARPSAPSAGTSAPVSQPGVLDPFTEFGPRLTGFPAVASLSSTSTKWALLVPCTFRNASLPFSVLRGCGLLSAVVAGDTTFANLDMTTTSGFLYSFVFGSTQTVTGSLTLLGAAANLLTIRSTLNGSEAFLNVQGSSADFVDVEDNDATAGNPVSLGPNSVKGSNTPGWLTAALVPALGALGLVAVGAGLYLTGHRSLRRRAHADA